MRQETGARIKLFDEPGLEGNRQVEIVGSAEQVGGLSWVRVRIWVRVRVSTDYLVDVYISKWPPQKTSKFGSVVLHDKHCISFVIRYDLVEDVTTESGACHAVSAPPLVSTSTSTSCGVVIQT